ncbi:hypothetical protein LCGC14_2733950 [marine sediment metagenome]|uniref:Uncharacterized protein n=1 Tax=marine sediment metagenome TaxID=412755 RepID=A0A0F9BFF7_9ZZZZ
MDIKVYTYKTLLEIEEIVNSSKRRIKDIELYPISRTSFNLLIKYE